MQSSCPPPETSISVKKLIFKYKKSEFFCFTWINCTGEHLKRKGNTGRIPNLKNMPFRETNHYFMFWLLFVFVKKLFYTSVIFVNFKFRIPSIVAPPPPVFVIRRFQSRLDGHRGVHFDLHFGCGRHFGGEVRRCRCRRCGGGGTASAASAADGAAVTGHRRWRRFARAALAGRTL